MVSAQFTDYSDTLAGSRPHSAEVVPAAELCESPDWRCQHKEATADDNVAVAALYAGLERRYIGYLARSRHRHLFQFDTIVLVIEIGCIE